MESKDILIRKKESLLKNELSEEELINMKPTKFLLLIIDEMETLLKFYTKKELHLMVNSIFKRNISLPLIYKFCKDYQNTDLKRNDAKTEIKHKKNQTLDKNQNVLNNIDDLTDSTLDFLSKNLPKK